MNQWKDLLSRNAKKFNTCLVRILKAKPTGVTEDQKVNMAITIHLGKIDTMLYCFKDFEPNDWKYHQAWLILRHQPAFLPPPAPTAANAENLASDDSDDEEETGKDDSSGSAAHKKKKKMPVEIKVEDDRKIKAVSSGSICEGSVRSVAKKNRGPGVGHMKTNQLVEQAEGYLDCTRYFSVVLCSLRTKSGERNVIGVAGVRKAPVIQRQSFILFTSM
jgi:hypothetical protein